jgi:hypothetical protein
MFIDPGCLQFLAPQERNRHRALFRSYRARTDL